MNASRRITPRQRPWVPKKTDKKPPLRFGDAAWTVVQQIEDFGLVPLADLCQLEVHALRRIAYLGQIEDDEAKKLDFFLGIPPKSWGA